MKFHTNDYIILITIIILLVVDHFMEWAPHQILSWLFAGVIIYNLNYRKYKEVSIKGIFNWQVISTLIIAGLIILFTLIGTQNDSEISFTSGVFLFMILLSVFEIVYQWRQMKQGTDER